MPRTKVVKKKTAQKTSPYIQNALDGLEEARKSVVLKFKQEEKKCLNEIKTQLNKTKLSIPAHLSIKTIGELLEHPLNWSGESTSVSIVQIMDATRSTTAKKKPLARSSSFADDEGYLTAEGSSNGTSGGRMSRSRSRTLKTTRVSRSLSTRNQTIKSTSSNKYKTPLHKVPPATYATVTPKVKPNTPQVLLRRPKQGEVALSLQGSPLLTGGVVTDNVANINIPLEDGRLLSIQPQRGLRISQIPLLDGEVKRQLETLRDNLNKVCAVASSRH